MQPSIYSDRCAKINRIHTWQRANHASFTAKFGLILQCFTIKYSPQTPLQVLSQHFEPWFWHKKVSGEALKTFWRP